MASIRTAQPAHQQPGRRGEPAGAALADARANYDGASRYEDRLLTQGRTRGAPRAWASRPSAPLASSRTCRHRRPEEDRRTDPPRLQLTRTYGHKYWAARHL